MAGNFHSTLTVTQRVSQTHRRLGKLFSSDLSSHKENKNI
jgi:hypothetical protein